MKALQDRSLDQVRAAAARLHELRREGERHPVLLSVAAGTFKKLVAEADDNEVVGRGPNVLLAVPASRAAELVDRHLSAGLGGALFELPFEPSSAFRFVRLHPKGLDWHIVILGDKDARTVDGLSLDLGTRVAQLAAENGVEKTIRFNW